MSQAVFDPTSACQSNQRRTASRGAARRKEILDVAESIFLRQGYDNTSVDEIAVSIGASKATIYKYFGSKNNLFSEILTNIVPDLADGLVNQIDSGIPFRDIMYNWSMKIINMITSPRSVSMYRIIVSETIRNSDVSILHYENGPKETQKELADFLRESAKRGNIECENPEIVSRVFVSGAFGEPFDYVLLGLPSPGASDLEAYVNVAISMLEAHCRIKQWG